MKHTHIGMHKHMHTPICTHTGMHKYMLIHTNTHIQFYQSTIANGPLFDTFMTEAVTSDTL